MSEAEQDFLERACAAQEDAAQSFEAGEEGEALALYRTACACFRIAMEHTIAPESMRRYLLAMQGLTVAAAVTGGIEEARMAAGTGRANAAVAFERWPEPPFDRLNQVFNDLIDKLGGGCPVFLSDDPASWPFDD